MNIATKYSNGVWYIVDQKMDGDRRLCKLVLGSIVEIRDHTLSKDEREQIEDFLYSGDLKECQK